MSKPNIGYGQQSLKYANGKRKDFYQIGLSANSTGLSLYIMGLDNKNYLLETYGETIGKAKLTGYCVKFKSLKYINLTTLEAAIIDGVGQTTIDFRVMVIGFFFKMKSAVLWRFKFRSLKAYWYSPKQGKRLVKIFFSEQKNIFFHNKLKPYLRHPKFHLKGGNKNWKKTQFHKYSRLMMISIGALTNAMLHLTRKRIA